MEVHSVFMATQDTSILHCTAHEPNTAFHATVKNSFSNRHSGLKYLPFKAYIVAFIFFEIAQINRLL